MAKIFRLSITAALLFMLISCNRSEVNISKAAGSDLPEKEPEHTEDLSFSEDELERIDELRGTGGLKAAVLISRDNYQMLDDGSIIGFDYMLADYFCKILNLQLVIDAQQDLSIFFEKNGNFDNRAVVENSMSYTPDLLKTNDVYILPLSITPWRERLMYMIPMRPAGLGLYGRDAEDITSFYQLEGLKAAILKDSYMEQVLTDIEEKYMIEIERVYHDADEETVIFVEDGRADFAIDGLVKSIKYIAEYPELSISELVVNKVTTGWAVKKDDHVLASILQKLNEYSLENGKLQELFGKNFGVDFDNYMDIIGD